MDIIRIQFPRKPAFKRSAPVLLCLAAAAVSALPSVLQGALVKNLSQREHYEPIVERNPFLPFFREEPSDQEEVEPPKPEPPADDREFYLQGIVRFRDGTIRAAVSEKDGQPTRLLKEGETQNATPESGLNDAIKMESIDPDEKKVTILVGGKSYSLSADGNKAELSKTQISRAKQIEQRQQAEAARPNNPNLRRSGPQPDSNNNMAAELARRRAERLQRLRELRESGQLNTNAPPPPSPPSFQGRGGPPGPGGR